MKHGQCIISGYINGQKFRPSNWSERLCEAGATFDPLKRVMRYSEFLYPRQCEQHGCSVYVDFDALDAELVSYISWFIDSNSMEVVAMRPAESNEAVPASEAVVPIGTNTAPHQIIRHSKKVAA